MDISEVGIEDILSQEFDAEKHPVLYVNRKLTPVKQKYAAIEREPLTIKWAVEEILPGGVVLHLANPPCSPAVDGKC